MFGKTLTARDIRLLNAACDSLRESCTGGCLQVGWCKACFDLCRAGGVSRDSIRVETGPKQDGGGSNGTI